MKLKKRLKEVLEEERRQNDELKALLLLLLLSKANVWAFQRNLPKLIPRVAAAIAAMRLSGAATGKRHAAMAPSGDGEGKASKPEPNPVQTAAAATLLVNVLRKILVPVPTIGSTAPAQGTPPAPAPIAFPSAVEAAVKGVETDIERIAATEVFSGYNEAFVQETLDKNPDATFEWCSVLDLRTCPNCESQDGKTFPANDLPTLPAHPRCRCVWIVR